MITVCVYQVHPALPLNSSKIQPHLLIPSKLCILIIFAC